MTNRLPLLPLVLLIGAGAVAQDQAAAKVDVAAQLSKAAARAKVHNKRVLLVFDVLDEGLANKLKRARAVSRALLYEFEVVPVGASDAAAVAARMHLPADRAGLAVLAADGQLRAWIADSTFVESGKVDGARLLKMLEPHFCAPVDAEKKLAAALAEAKKSGRNVFVRFDAPW